ASSREKTVIFLGRPSSPVSKRRTRTLPSEPVPPVTTIFLSVSNRPPKFRIRSGIVEQSRNHIRPTWRDKTGRLKKTSAVQAPVANERVIRFDLHVQAAHLFDEHEQIEFVNWFRGDVPDTLQSFVMFDKPRNYF